MSPKTMSSGRPESVEDTRDRLTLAIEAADIGTFYCPMPLQEIIWNAKCKEHFWLPPDAHVDFDLFYALLHPDDRERTRAAIDAAVFAGAGYDIEYRTISPKGDVRWIRAKGSTRYDANENPMRFDGITIDISAQKQLEADRHRLLESERLQRQQAQQANDMKDTFIATVSHELRAPLTAIQAWVDLLNRRANESEFVKSGVEVIRRNVEAQTRLVDDLLDLSRVTAGKLAITRTLVRLSESVDAELSELRPLAHRKGVLVEADLASDTVMMADPIRLRQIFANLLSNALKYTPSGGKITARMRARDDSVEISIGDTGEGIPPSLLNTIFEPFAQVDGSTTRKHGGLGLGLPIARSLVGMHEGSLTASSDGPGKGSTFTVTLPRSVTHVLDEHEGASNQAEEHASADVAGLTVLLVDDDKDTLDAFALVFAEAQVVVHAALSPARAREILAQHTVDAIFSDISMPGEDGYQFVSSLRARAIETPAIAITAFVREEDRRRARTAGFNDHLGKPVEPAKLVATLAQVALGRGVSGL